MGLILHSFAVPPSPVTVPESSITLPESAPNFRDEFAVDSPLQRGVRCELDTLGRGRVRGAVGVSGGAVDTAPLVPRLRIGVAYDTHIPLKDH